MNRGCIFGCLGVLFLGLVVVVVAVFTLNSMFNIFTPTERVDLAAVYGQDHAITARLDPDVAFMYDLTGTMTRQEPWMIELFVPHEILVAFDADATTGTKEFTAAASTKRFAVVFSAFMDDLSGMEMFGGMAPDEVQAQDNGVILFRASGPVSEEALAHVASLEPNPGDVPFAFEGGHVLEVMVNNTEGQLVLSMDKYIVDAFAPDSDVNAAPAEPAEPVEPPASDVPGESDASPGEAETPVSPDPPAPAVEITEEEWRALIESITVGRMTANNVPESDGLGIELELRCRDEASAAAAFAVMQDLQVLTKDRMEEEQATFEGTLQIEGRIIRGEFTLGQFENALKNDSKEFWRDMERGVERDRRERSVTIR